MMCTFLSFSVVLFFHTPGFIVDTFTVYSLRRKNFSQKNIKKETEWQFALWFLCDRTTVLYRQESRKKNR